MSFILDALKKSESDRQRRSGPALFEVKVAPPRTRLPAWAIAIACLLAVNLGIVVWMVLRRPAHEGAAVALPPAAAATAAALPPAAAAPPSAAATVAPATVVAAPPAAAAPAPAAAAPGPAAPGPAQGAASLPAAGEPNPEDYAPAEEPPAGGPGGGPRGRRAPAGGPLGGHVRRGTASGVPLYQDATAAPGTQLPQLRLDLHVFASRPQDRFVMINMHKLHEGESLPEGVRVDSITPEGAVMSYNGQKFLLPRE
jgi:general secretion pathway protein B